MSEEKIDATGDKVPELNGAGLNKNIDTHRCHSDSFLISMLLPHSQHIKWENSFLRLVKFFGSVLVC